MAPACVTTTVGVPAMLTLNDCVADPCRASVTWIVNFTLDCTLSGTAEIAALLLGLFVTARLSGKDPALTLHTNGAAPPVN